MIKQVLVISHHEFYIPNMSLVTPQYQLIQLMFNQHPNVVVIKKRHPLSDLHHKILNDQSRNGSSDLHLISQHAVMS